MSEIKCLYAEPVLPSLENDGKLRCRITGFEGTKKQVTEQCPGGNKINECAEEVSQGILNRRYLNSNGTPLFIEEDYSDFLEDQEESEE